MISTLTRERKKIDRNLSGIRHMTRLPEALLVVDPHREHIAVKEARKLGIKVVALLDTDCDPDDVDLPIPGNDDSMRSIELVVKRLIDAIIEGKASAPVLPPPREDEGAPQGQGRGDREAAATAEAAAVRAEASRAEAPRSAARADAMPRPQAPAQARPRRPSRRCPPRPQEEALPAPPEEQALPAPAESSESPASAE